MFTLSKFGRGLAMISCEMDPQKRTEEYDLQGYSGVGISSYIFEFSGHRYELKISDTIAKLELQVNSLSTGNIHHVKWISKIII